MLDLEAPNITAQIERIVGMLKSKPHLFANVIRMPAPCWRDKRLAAEFGANPTRLEDEGMRLLKECPQSARIQALQRWFTDGLIDVDQAVFLASMCGINPRELTR